MNPYPFIPYRPARLSAEIMRGKLEELKKTMLLRRSVRQFSPDPIPIDVLQLLIGIAGTAPSGANKQPWTFCLVTNRELKKQIREAAEEEERKNYTGRMSEEWLRDLAPLGTDENKSFLEIAPALIVVFKRSYEFDQDGKKHQNYYVTESVGLASGFLIQAIQEAGLVCLTHTPSPMNFLEKILGRPSNEKSFLLIPIGYPAEDCFVPDIKKKEMAEILVHFD
ncbi:MAG: nitroreductase family protein [Flavobacteriales bacterium]|nr:nitroreductase family protein [Flavobacteriales bacterium]